MIKIDMMRINKVPRNTRYVWGFIFSGEVTTKNIRGIKIEAREIKKVIVSLTSNCFFMIFED